MLDADLPIQLFDRDGMMEKKRKKNKDGHTRKEAILETATQFFAEKGFNNTAIGDIARMIDVADGTIFYHYKTKEDLFVAVLENFKEILIQEAQNYLEQHEFSSGLEMVEGLINFYLNLADRMEDRFLLLHSHFPYKLAEDNASCRRHLEDIYVFFTGHFETAIIRGQKDGSIRRTSARKMAMILFTIVDGLVRLGTYHLYQPGALREELLASCRRMLDA